MKICISKIAQLGDSGTYFAAQNFHIRNFHIRNSANDVFQALNITLQDFSSKAFGYFN